MRTFFNEEVEKITMDENLIKSISWKNIFKDIIDIDCVGERI